MQKAMQTLKSKLSSDKEFAGFWEYLGTESDDYVTYGEFTRFVTFKPRKKVRKRMSVDMVLLHKRQTSPVGSALTTIRALVERLFQRVRLLSQRCQSRFHCISAAHRGSRMERGPPSGALSRI